MAKILIVEDDPALANIVNDWLRKENHVVDRVANGKDGLERLQAYDYDLVILDIDLPQMSGYEVCKRYRQSGGKAGIIMLTGKGAIDDREEGLDSGADDYLTKPFHPRELSARIRSLLRRSPLLMSENVITCGDVVMDIKRLKVSRADREIQLNPMEFALLEFFMRNPGQYFSQDALLNRVWSSESDASPDTVRFHIAKLRSKLDREGETSLIKTQHRIGYCFDPKPDRDRGKEPTKY